MFDSKQQHFLRISLLFSHSRVRFRATSFFAQVSGLIESNQVFASFVSDWSRVRFPTCTFFVFHLSIHFFEGSIPDGHIFCADTNCQKTSRVRFRSASYFGGFWFFLFFLFRKFYFGFILGIFSVCDFKLFFGNRLEINIQSGKKNISWKNRFIFVIQFLVIVPKVFVCLSSALPGYLPRHTSGFFILVLQDTLMSEDCRSELQKSPTEVYKLAKYRRGGGQEIKPSTPAVEELLLRIYYIEVPDLKWYILKFLPLPKWRTGKNYIVDGEVFHRAPGWIHIKIDECYEKQSPYIPRKAKEGEFCGWGPIRQN